MSDLVFPALMFAAGFGTRMKSLTKDRPKPLINVGGMPLIDHSLKLVQAARCEPVTANLHYKADMLRAHLEPKGVTCSVEEPDILETGGGLRHALPLLGTGPVVTSNTDAIWSGPNPVEMMRDIWDPAKMDALLICVPRENADGHNGTGDFLLSDEGQLTRGPGLVYGGVQIIKTDGLAAIKERAFSLNLLWDTMLREGRIYGLRYPGRWCDVGHPEGIALAEQMLRSADV